MIPANSPIVAALAPYDPNIILQSTTVTYGFAAAGLTIDTSEVTGSTSTSVAWTESQMQLVRDTFTYISSVVDLNFQESAAANVTIIFQQVPNLTTPVPDPLGETAGYTQAYTDGSSEIVLPTAMIPHIVEGTDNTTVIHEIAHAIGLSHPFDGPSNLPGVTSTYDDGDFALNTELATRMSYTPGKALAHPGVDIRGEASTLGAIDIAALQLLYGANETTGTGDTVYGIDPVLNTIWDTGGHDLLDFSQASENAVIDLRAATLAVDEGGGGFLSFIGAEGGTVANGGYTIAFGVEIEDARGGAGNDQITGNALANLLSGNGGNDAINGGGGMDTALYSGDQSSYTLTLSAASTTLADRREGGDGTDTLSEVEALAFGDNTGGPFTLNTGTTSLTESQMESFIELYIAYFNRAPDAIGLNFWGNAFATGTTLEQSATFFIDQDETRATYPDTLTNADFASAVYSNVLGRQPDAVGFDFWVGVLDSGAVGRDQFILSVLQGAKAAPPAGADDEFIIQQLADQQYLSIKTDIGAYYAVTKGLSDVGNASAAMALFDGSIAGRNAARDAIDGYHTAALDADTGAFLMPLVGVLDDPFAGIA